MAGPVDPADPKSPLIRRLILHYIAGTNRASPVKHLHTVTRSVCHTGGPEEESGQKVHILPRGGGDAES